MVKASTSTLLASSLTCFCFASNTYSKFLISDGLSWPTGIWIWVERTSHALHHWACEVSWTALTHMCFQPLCGNGVYQPTKTEGWNYQKKCSDTLSGVGLLCLDIVSVKYIIDTFCFAWNLYKLFNVEDSDPVFQETLLNSRASRSWSLYVLKWNNYTNGIYSIILILKITDWFLDYWPSSRESWKSLSTVKVYVNLSEPFWR